MSIHSILSEIQTKFKSKKSRYNSFGKYNFRSAEDILEALKPFNAKHGVYFTITEEYLGDAVIMSTATIHHNGESIPASAIVGVDLNQKGMQRPQQYGSASSYAKKYALGNLLLIDDTADSDATNAHGKAPQAKLKMDAAAIQGAKDFVKNGGSISAIKAKYDVTPEIEKQING